MKIRSLGLATALLAALAGPASAQIKDHVFKVGIGLSEDHPQAQALKYFADQLAAKSGGKLVARVYTSGSLGNDVSMTSALRGGTLEMTIPDSSTLVSLIKPFGVLNLPLTFNNEKEADGVLDGPSGRSCWPSCPKKA
jgi:TRAP-type C4-dicarboxylate transport system substrate-binding protein